MNDIVETLSSLPCPTCGSLGWQPIETAPKDGRDVLLYCKRGSLPDLIISGYWHNGNTKFGVRGHWMTTNHELTFPPQYWRTLPKPPETG